MTAYWKLGAINHQSVPGVDWLCTTLFLLLISNTDSHPNSISFELILILTEPISPLWELKIQSYIFWTLSPSTTDLKMPEFKRNGYILTGVCTQQGHNWFWNVHYWWYCSMTMVKPGNSSPGLPEDRHHGTVEFLTNQEIIETIELHQPRRQAAWDSRVPLRQYNFYNPIQPITATTTN